MNVERELKLEPENDSLLDQLADLDQLGPFLVTGRAEERQHNSFFDNRQRGFASARIGFRRRVIEGQPLATWTIKGDGLPGQSAGVAARPEIELQLDADMPPGLALGALRDTARQRGARALAEQVGDALAQGGLPLAQPVLETVTVRQIRDLEAPERGWRAEMALDRVQLVGHHYAEREIEVELKHGDEAALDEARAAIAALGAVSESHGSKLSRALAHARSCACR